MTELKTLKDIETEYKEIKHKGKTFRIYKWEDKEIGKFPIPKGFDFAEHSDFIELFDSKKIDYPKNGWRFYFTKHFSKRKQKEKILSSSCLGRYSGLGSYDSDLAYSDNYGRVVLVKTGRELE